MSGLGMPAVHIRSKRIDLYALEHCLRAAGWLQYACSTGRRVPLRTTDRVELPRPVERILAVQLFKLGDLVMTVPALEALRRLAPAASLSLLALPGLADFARRIPAVDNVVVLHGLRDLRALHRLRGEHFDLAVVFNPRVLGAWLATVAGARTVAGYVSCPEGRSDQSLGRTGASLLQVPVQPDLEPCHETERYAALVEVLGGGAGPTVPRLWLTEQDREFALRFLAANGIADERPLIGISPCAGWVSRQWPAERWAMVIRHAVSRLQGHLLFWGTTGERALLERIRRLSGVPSVSAVGQTDLPQLAGLVAACDFIICADSGPMHVGAGFDVPLVALFGPSDETKLRPAHARHLVARHSVACSPCSLQYAGDCPNNVCMKGLRVEHVCAAVDAAVDRWVAPPEGPRRESLDRHVRLPESREAPHG